VYTVALLMALTASADAPDCGRGRGGCYSYGGGYSCGCYSYGGGYGYGGCYSYGGYPSYGGCYVIAGYGIGGYGMASYSASYSKAPDETDDEFAFCQEKAQEMSPPVYQNFRNSVWLQMTHDERSKMMEKDRKGKKSKKGGSDEEASLESRARLVVTLPADATLTIADQAMQSDGSRRVFVSPPLKPDRSYSYTLKAEFVREGKTVSVTKKAGVSAGKETLVSFDDSPQTDVASR
jgi:uncharacterized protein (TIGR03000 family)